MNIPTSDVSVPTPMGRSPYRLTDEQQKVYDWLKGQGLNVDDDTVNYWARKYTAKRLVDVVRFAHAKRAQGHEIRNMGGWIHKMLKDGMTVVTDECESNRTHTQRYAKENNWESLQVYEKYIKDRITGDDLPLTLSKDEFCRALEALYQRVQLYQDKG